MPRSSRACSGWAVLGRGTDVHGRHQTKGGRQAMTSESEKQGPGAVLAVCVIFVGLGAIPAAYARPDDAGAPGARDSAATPSDSSPALAPQQPAGRQNSVPQGEVATLQAELDGLHRAAATLSSLDPAKPRPVGQDNKKEFRRIVGPFKNPYQPWGKSYSHL